MTVGRFCLQAKCKAVPPKSSLSSKLARASTKAVAAAAFLRLENRIQGLQAALVCTWNIWAPAFHQTTHNTCNARIRNCVEQLHHEICSLRDAGNQNINRRSEHQTCFSCGNTSREEASLEAKRRGMEKGSDPAQNVNEYMTLYDDLAKIAAPRSRLQE
jgi:hypothetical protein